MTPTTMPGIDTNLLVRLLVADDAVQLKQVLALIQTAKTQGETLYVPITVILELEWVLRSRYNFEKATLIKILGALLETREFELQSEAALEQALHDFNNSTADFADCLHTGLCVTQGRTPLLTFDTKAARLPNAKLLSPVSVP